MLVGEFNLYFKVVVYCYYVYVENFLLVFDNFFG